VLLGDVGFGLADTLGGEVHTPTLTRLANEGVAFNQFHTTYGRSVERSSCAHGPAFIHAAPQRYGKSHPARDVIAIALDGVARFGSHAG
jgi:hypothetical protein